MTEVVDNPLLSSHGAIKEVACVDLDTRLICVFFHSDARFRAIGLSGKDGVIERYSVGVKKDDAYSWSHGQTQGVK